jgi:hypothetical protein
MGPLVSTQHFYQLSRVENANWYDANGQERLLASISEILAYLSSLVRNIWHTPLNCGG